jgi:hypothetical protein
MEKGFKIPKCIGPKVTRARSRGRNGLLWPKLTWRSSLACWAQKPLGWPGSCGWSTARRGAGARWRGSTWWVRLHGHSMAWPTMSRRWPKLYHDSVGRLKATPCTSPTRWLGRQRTEMRWWQGRRISPACRGVPVKGGSEAVVEAPRDVLHDEGGARDH